MSNFKLVSFIAILKCIFMNSLYADADFSIFAQLKKDTYTEVDYRKPFVRDHAIRYFFSGKINSGQYRSYVSMHSSFKISDPKHIEDLIVMEGRMKPLVRIAAKMSAGGQKQIIKEIIVTPVSEVGEIDNGEGKFTSGKSSKCYRRYKVTTLDAEGQENVREFDQDKGEYSDIREESPGCSDLISFFTQKLGLSPLK